MAEVTLLNICTKHQHVCSTFARHTKQTHKSQPSKRAANAASFSNQAETAVFNRRNKYRQERICASHKTPCPPTTPQIKKYLALFVFLILTLITSSTYGQFSIKGQIKSLSNNELSFATVIINKDTSFVKNLFTDSLGYFKLENLKEGRYNIKISYLGFISKDTTINIVQNESFIILLISNTKELEQVTVKSKKDFIEKKADRIIYNIEGRPLFENKSVTDILKNIPRLNITRNSIEIRGKGLASVMINDRIIYLSSKDLLEYLNIYKNDIISIEVIPNPPAKYDAEGAGGLINIITKKGKVKGIFGDFENSTTKNTYLTNDDNLNLRFRNKNFSLLSSIGSSFGAYQEKTNYKSEFLTPAQSSWEDIAKNKVSLKSYRINLAADYLVDKNIKINACFSQTYSNNTTAQNHTLEYLNNYLKDSIGSTTGGDTTKVKTNILNFGIHSSIGKKGGSIDMSVDYINKSNNQNSNSLTTNYYNFNNPTNSNYGLFNYGKTPKNIFSSRADFMFPNLIKKYTFEFGSKFTVFNNKSNIAYDKTLNNQSVLVGQNTKDTFNYKENNIAAYISISKETKKWSSKFGIRYEGTFTEGKSSITNTTNTFNNIFPSAFIQYKITEETSLDISYTRRINRPKIWDVNPYKWYTGIYSLFTGNPLLTPSLQDNIEVNYNLKNKFLFNAFFNVAHNPIISLPYNIGNTIESRKTNNGTLENFGLNIDASLNFKSWMQNNFSLNISSYNFKTDYQFQQSHKPINISLSTNHSFQFTKTFSSDISFSATLPNGGNNVSIQKGYSSLDVGCTKFFLKNKLILTLSVQDIFASNTQGATTTTNTFISTNSNYYDFRQATISVKYKFGKELKTVRKRNNIQETNRL